MAGAGQEFGNFAADVNTYGYGQPPFGGGGFPGSGNAPAGGYGFSAPPFGTPAAFQNEMASPLDAEIQVVLREIHGELQSMEHSGEFFEQFKNARRLLATEATKLENNIDPEWLEVDINKPIKVTKKVLIPSFRHPKVKFNFVGKVLGPKGTTLQNIAKTYKCHVYILGRGSTRDRAKEQELLGSGDPQYAHYGGPLHVKVETTAPPAIAYQRVAGVLGILAELLQPVKDTHIDGITTEPNPGVQGDDLEGGGQEGGSGSNSNGADMVGTPKMMGGAGGGPMKPRGGLSGGRGRGGGMGRGGSSGIGGRGGGFIQRGGGGRGGRGGGFQQRGGAGGRGGGGSGQRGYQPY